MSLKLNSSGGGSVTLQEPSTASNQTLTLPDNTGTILTTATPGVPVNGPAFFAYSTGQSLSNGVYTKTALNAESFDTNGNFDSTTNYRFTPNVAGYYFVQGLLTMAGVTWTNGFANCYVYKNGSAVLSSATSQPSNGNWISVSVCGLVYMNGSTDYLEMYTLHAGASSSPLNIVGGTNTYMSGFLARAA